MNKNKFVAIALVALFLSSCVSSKVHNELLGKYSAVSEENNRLLLENQDYMLRNEEMDSKINRVAGKMGELVADTARLFNELSRLQRNYDDLNKSYEFLLENNNTLLANNARESKALLEQLEAVQQSLTEKEALLKEERETLTQLTTALQAREAKVKELEGLIARKDSINEAVKNSVSNALLGFTGKGLTVETKNGLVYVSMENSLLFKSGSWLVEARGKEALEQLAQVLSENPDIRISVEGHTDSDAFRGSGQVRDNWDLSVMRATSVVKILTDNKGVDPLRVTAAGRGEFLPLAPNDTSDGKAKNRRIEIILTPNLSELFELVGSK
jgi:chemotaxis protein MotB